MTEENDLQVEKDVLDVLGDQHIILAVLRGRDGHDWEVCASCFDGKSDRISWTLEKCPRHPIDIHGKRTNREEALRCWSEPMRPRIRQKWKEWSGRPWR